MQLTEYVEVLWRWGWVIILVTGLCSAAAIGFGKLQTPRYTSLVELTVMPARIDQGLSQTVINLFRNYAAAIQSEGMARRVIEELGLTAVHPSELQPRIVAEALPTDFKIAIEATDWDPVLAQRIAQKTAELFAGDVAAYSAGLDPLDQLSVTLLNNGALPANRTWPRNKLLAFLGLGGGLVAGLLIALRLEWLRLEALRSAEEVERETGLTVIGRIPSLRPPRRPVPRWPLTRRFQNPGQL